jgi:hypothetical protein
VARGTGDGNSLANVNTTNLPNAALCMVQDQGTLYRLDKTSTIDPVLPTDPGIIVPGSGPGRWFAMTGQEAELAFAYEIGMNNASAVVVANPQNWTALGSTTAWTVEDSILTAGTLVATAFWSTTTPSAGVLTYNGPDAFIEAYASVVLANAEAANAQTYGLLISKNGAGLGDNDEFVREGQQAAATGNAQDPNQVTAFSRMFLTDGDTVQILIINRAVEGDDVAVSRAVLAVNLA